MRTRQEGAESLPGETCVIVKIATTGCDRAEDELLELTLLDARTPLDTPVMPPPLYFGRFRPRRHRDWPEAGARNGLAPSDVQDAPEPEDPRERGRVQRVLDGTGVLAGFNLPFTLAFLSDVSISWRTGRATPRERGRTAVPCGSAWEISSAPCG